MLLTSAGLTAVSLLIVQRSVENQVRRNLRVDLANSVETFRNFQQRARKFAGALGRVDGGPAGAEGADDLAPCSYDPGRLGRAVPAFGRRPVCAG